MDYVLFTYPDCQKCADLKAYLKHTPLKGQEMSLVQKEGKMRIREFLPLVKRDEKGSIILPTLVLLEGGRPAAVVNRAEELDLWLKSRP
jgi:glutaredoxin